MHIAFCPFAGRSLAGLPVGSMQLAPGNPVPEEIDQSLQIAELRAST
jgi:hypothetical protein